MKVVAGEHLQHYGVVPGGLASAIATGSAAGREAWGRIDGVIVALERSKAHMSDIGTQGKGFKVANAVAASVVFLDQDAVDEPDNLYSNSRYKRSVAFAQKIPDLPPYPGLAVVIATLRVAWIAVRFDR